MKKLGAADLWEEAHFVGYRAVHYWPLLVRYCLKKKKKIYGQQKWRSFHTFVKLHSTQKEIFNYIAENLKALKTWKLDFFYLFIFFAGLAMYGTFVRFILILYNIFWL